MSNNDAAARRLLPQQQQQQQQQQNAQMGAFSFAPQQYQQQPRETQKNYVFVDEHNRHKRLKVMRACEGCRRRKIKCDAATTNTWPCSACIRLKLHCVRPNGFDGAADTQVYETVGPGQTDFEAAVPAQPQGQDGFRQHVALAASQQHMLAAAPKQPTMYAPQTGFAADAAALYQPAAFSDAPHNLHYTTVPPPIGMVDPSYAAQSMFPTPPLQQSSQPDSPPESYSTDQFQQNDLADLLGALKMNEAGTAPYLNKKMLARGGENEDPELGDDDDYRSSLPPLVSGPGLKIRIPPELMPDDDTILHYFELYFANVHPYVPVLDRSLFFQQWNTNRESISPLLLEAIFAIGGRLADDPAQGQQWLALATKHADSFMDVPRLSTLQALLIVLKAREAAPKRGYYYRSWMAIVQCVQMGKDLGLDEHMSDHKAGKPCGSSPAECLMKTRIWQTTFVCELMIGSPQGRTDLAVLDETVDMRVPRPGVDEAEYHTSRNFTYFTRVVANVSRMNRVYARIKQNKDWGADPEFTQLNPSLHAWLNDLPPDLAVNFPPDGSPPWLPSPFIGNLHSYYYLSIIMLHRPQLQVLNPTSADGQWKHHMLICYSSAKLLCRLEEAILQSFGLVGLQSMQRGVNFTIYAILTCIVLHLVALTSPDADLSSDARDYFTRHMRILETCMSAWPMPDMQKHIDAVREAFSADIRKPFVLKPSFPYGSPLSTAHSTPPRSTAGFPSGVHPATSLGHRIDTVAAQQPISYASQPISPPVSAGPVDIKPEQSPAGQSLLLMAAAGQGGQVPGIGGAVSMTGESTWNPSRIFAQWNTTFGTPQAQSQSSSSTSPPLSVPPSSAGAPEVSTLDDIQAVHASLPQGLHQQQPATAAAAAAAAAVASQYAAPAMPSFVTPAMWQESVASVYEGGLKRQWDYDVNAMSMAKRR